jgi:hydroxyethylthiazole kinase
VHQVLRDPQLVEHQAGAVMIFLLVWLAWPDRHPPAQRPLDFFWVCACARMHNRLSSLDLKTTFAAYDLLERVRKQSPVVHHLTNWVTIYDCAQVVKTLGASPVMAHAPEEMADMTQIASALVLNIGTLTVEMVESMKLAALNARKRGIPVVLDACGAGATRLRDEKCLELLDTGAISILKGNVSEIARLAGASVSTRGVDAGTVRGDVVQLVRELASRRSVTVVVTGKIDIVTAGGPACLIANGHEMMTRVVGTGCMAASVIGAFAAVEKDFVQAAAAGLACYEIAAELGAESCTGPSSFKNRLFDCLYTLDRAAVEKRQQVQFLA